LKSIDEVPVFERSHGPSQPVMAGPYPTRRNALAAPRPHHGPSALSGPPRPLRHASGDVCAPPRPPTAASGDRQGWVSGLRQVAGDRWEGVSGLRATSGDGKERASGLGRGAGRGGARRGGRGGRRGGGAGEGQGEAVERERGGQVRGARRGRGPLAAGLRPDSGGRGVARVTSWSADRFDGPRMSESRVHRGSRPRSLCC